MYLLIALGILACGLVTLVLMGIVLWQESHHKDSEETVLYSEDYGVVRGVDPSWINPKHLNDFFETRTVPRKHPARRTRRSRALH